MEFINHTLNWCKGEIFEGKMSILFGIILLTISFAYFKWGSTPYAKAIFWPLLVISILAIGAGVYLLSANSKRIENYPTQFEKNPAEFVQAEKQRTEAFIKVYPVTFKILFVLMIIGMSCMLFSDKALIRTLGIGFMLLSFYGFLLDHFSEERAMTYHSHIKAHLSK